MESISHLSLFLLFSCFVFSPSPVGGRSPIVDVSRKPVLRGVPYYVGALGMTSLNYSCPLNVYAGSRTPVMLFPEKARANKTVFAGENLFVMFAEPSVCENSTQWKFDPTSGLVKTGGARPALPPYVDFARFRAVGHPPIGLPSYGLWSCPSPSILCTKLGVTGKEKLLGNSSTPLVVSFFKVPETRMGSAAIHPTA